MLYVTPSATELIVLCGLSGAGKTVAIRALEDAGYCGIHVVDTSEMTALILTKWMQQYIDDSHNGLTIVVQSFGFKHGIPNDTDMMFDARCLPNPYYNPALRPMTGLDCSVIEYFEQLPIMADFCQGIATFLTTWRSVYEADHRKYLNVGIGCTGGQHRSVYLSEMLGKMPALGKVRVRHRDAHHWPAK